MFKVLLAIADTIPHSKLHSLLVRYTSMMYKLAIVFRGGHYRDHHLQRIFDNVVMKQLGLKAYSRLSLHVQRSLLGHSIYRALNRISMIGSNICSWMSKTYSSSRHFDWYPPVYQAKSFPIAGWQFYLPVVLCLCYVSGAHHWKMIRPVLPLGEVSLYEWLSLKFAFHTPTTRIEYTKCIFNGHFIALVSSEA